jgi:hypothetical protein
MFVRTALRFGVAAVALAGCNPIFTDPVSLGGELEVTSVLYDGPPGAWAEVAVRDAADVHVYAFAVVDDDVRTGPSIRSCGDASGTTECLVTASDVRMPNQVLVPGDGSAYEPLMTVWPGERLDLVLVCVDPATQELACPPGLRTVIRTVDEGGARVGDLGVTPSPGAAPALPANENVF